MQVFILKYFQIFCTAIPLYFINCDQTSFNVTKDNYAMYQTTACIINCTNADPEKTIEICYNNCLYISKENIKPIHKKKNATLELMCRSSKTLVLKFIDDADTDLKTNNSMEFEKGSSRKLYILRIEENFNALSTIYMTDSPIIKLDKLVENAIYNISATILNDKFEYNYAAEFMLFQTLKHNYMPGRIQNIQYEYSHVDANNYVIDLYLTWKPGIDMTCLYEIYYGPRHSEFYIQINEPKDLYRVLLPNIKIDAKYNLALYGLNLENESISAIPTYYDIYIDCLDYYKNNLEQCAPYTPSNVTAIFIKQGEYLYDVNVTWNEPILTPDTHLIRAIDRHGQIKSVQAAGNETYACYKNTEFSYENRAVFVTAISLGGNKTAEAIIIETLLKDDSHILNLGIMESIIIIILVLLIIIYLIYRHKILKVIKPIEKIESITTIIDPITIQIQNFQNELTAKLSHDDEMEVNKDNIQLLESLGEGAFGVVRKGLLLPSRTEVAVKMLKDHPGIDDIKGFQGEIEVMKSVGKHPNIVSIIGHCTVNIFEMMLLTEYCSEGNLLDYLRNIFMKICANNVNIQQQCHKSGKTICSTSIANDALSMNSNNQVNYTTPVFKLHKTVINNRLYTDAQYTENHNRIVNRTNNNRNNNNNNDIVTQCHNKCKCYVKIIKSNFNIMQKKQKIYNNKIKIEECTCRIISKATGKKPISAPIAIFSNKNYGRTILNNNNRSSIETVVKANESKIVTAINNYISYNDQCNINNNNNIIYNNINADNNTIEDITRIQNQQFINIRDLLEIAKQVALGMEFLACNRIVHRDLAARNILVCADKTVKIADFGLSRDVYLQNVYKKIKGGKLPIKWLALESLTHQIYTTQSDVWSYGILLYEIITFGSSPYPTVDRLDTILPILKSGYRMSRPQYCSEELYELMLSCWNCNANERPTFTDILSKLESFIMNPLYTELLGDNFTDGYERPLNSASTTWNI